MICPKCKSDNPEKTESCPKCGVVYEKYIELLKKQQAAKQKAVKEHMKKKEPPADPPPIVVSGDDSGFSWLKPVVIVSCLVVSVIVLIWLMRMSSDKSYVSDLKMVTDNMVFRADDCVIECRDIAKAWKDAINKGEDFSSAVYGKMTESLEEGDYRKRNEDKAEITRDLKELASPPEKYSKAFEMAAELYSNYALLYSLAERPKGNLLSYTAQVDQLEFDVIKISYEIKALLP